MKKNKLLPVYLFVTAALYGVAFSAIADGVVYDDTSVGQRIDINSDIIANGNALTIKDPVDIKYSLWIGRDNSKVDIISKDGIGLVYQGKIKRPDTINIQNGSIIQGKETAIQINSQNQKLVIYVDGSIIGSIKAENDGQDHEIFFGQKRQTNELGKDALFQGSDITGISKITNVGNLTVASGNNGSNWHDADFISNDKSSLNFKLENANINSPFISTKRADIETSNVKLQLGTGINVDDIDGKDIVLIKTSNNVIKLAGTKVLLIDDTGNSLINSNNQKITNPNEWIVEQKVDAVVKSWLTDSNTKWVFRYTKGKGLNLVKADSLANIKALFPQGNSDTNNYLTGIVTEQLGTNNDIDKLFRKNRTNTEMRILTRQMIPDLSGGDIESAFNYVEKMRSHIGNRTLRYSNQLPEGDRESGWNLWATTDYSTGKNNDTYDYKLNRYGIQAGIDQQINDQALLGFSLGLNHNDIENNASSTKKATQFVFMPYYEWRDGFYFANINSDFGILYTQSRRDIGDTTASGSYSSFQFGYQVVGGVEKQLYNDVWMKPYASLKYQWITNQGWHEDGSPLALAYESQKYAARHIGGGLSIWKAFETSAGSLVPSLDIQYYKLIGSSDKLSQNVDLASQIPTTGDAKGKYKIDGNALFGDQLSVRLNASLDVSPTFNITGSTGYTRFGKYKESVFGLTFSNRF